MKALIGVGSNLDERSALMAEAVDHLRCLEGLGRASLSHLYETRPWGRSDQPDFLNAVASFDTEMEPTALLDECQGIERKMGRRSSGRWGPRRIDLDLLDIGGRIIGEDSLTLPHTGISRRAFVLIPVIEIAPDWTDPISGKSAIELLAALDPDPNEVRLFGRFPNRGEVNCQRPLIRPS